MKIRSLIKITGTIVFFLCILILTIDYFTTIKFSFHHYFFYFWGIYLTSFIVLLFNSKYKFYLLFIGVLAIVFSLYPFLNSEQKMGVRKNILNSQYEIIAHYSDYQVIEIYLFLEWVVVEKESTIFFNPRSKLGILHSFEFEAKLVDETKKMVIVAIKTNRNGKIIDTLKKQKILITY